MAGISRSVQGAENRIKMIVSLPIASLDRLKLKQRLDEIGQRAPAVIAIRGARSPGASFLYTRSH
jgi:hypothetical protein